MKNIHLVLYVLIVVTFIAPSCNKPSVIGGELLEQDKADLLYTDTLTIIAKTILSDSIKTFDIASQLDNFLCGDLVDPIFGGVKATNYLQARLSSLNPDFENAVFDSIVLSVAYDTIGLYGNYSEQHTINVHRLSEELDNTELYYSSDAFMFDATPFGTKTFNPDPFNNEVPVISYYNNEPSFDTISATLRIPLDDNFGMELLTLDTLTYEWDTLFTEYFNGIYVESEGTNKESMLSFDWGSLNSRISLYYRNDTDSMQFDYNIFPNASVKAVNFDHYGAAGSNAGNFVDNTTLGDSLLFVQSMQGTNVSFVFPNVEAFNDVIINKAELELTIATIPQSDAETFEPVEQFLLSEPSDDGELLLIEDVVRAFSVGDISVFGATLEEETDGMVVLEKYKLNLSAVFQNMVLGDVSNEVILTVFLGNQRANRSIIFGPGHSQHPAKLNLTYTNQ